jgi:hypothetical protein
VTKDGIEYNLDITPYSQLVEYDSMILEFKFSSKFYLKKFNKLCNSPTYDKGMLKYNFEVDVTFLEDLKTYINVEKRGFQIVKNNTKKFKSINEMKIKTIFDIL